LLERRVAEVLIVTWTLIANATLARFFNERSDGSLHLIRTVEHPVGRARSHDLGSDRPGRCQKGTGRRSAFEPHTNLTDVALDHLVSEIVANLVAGVDAGECDAIVLVAPPRLLGRLRAAIPGPLAHRVVESFVLDLGRRHEVNIPSALSAARASIAARHPAIIHASQHA
jgi:protein required for attachment to host cells